MSCRFFFALLLLLPVLVARAAAPPLVLAEHDTRIVLNPHLDWWKDAPPDTGLADVLRADAQFAPAPAGASLGPHAGALWFRVGVSNASAQRRDLLLEQAFANLDEFDLYVVRGGRVIAQRQTGAARPVETRAIDSPRFLFPLELRPRDTVTLYLRVASSTVVNLPLTLYDQRAYIAHADGARGWTGLFYGLSLGTLLYAGFLWRTTGERAFLHYTIGGFLAVGYFASLDGFVSMVLPEPLGLQRFLLFFCAILSVSFTLWFARGFLETAGRDPRADRLLGVVAAFALLVSAVLVFLPPVAGMALAMLLSIAMALLMFFAGVSALRAGYRPARLFVVAISVHMASVTLLSAGALLDVPGLFAVADTGHRIGFVFNLVCFTLALSQRIRLLADERREAEESILRAASDSRARNEFLSHMSHELRTPMTGVLGMAELLDHTELDPRQRRYLSTLRYSGEILLNLINDMLDHVRIEAGRLQVRRDAFDLLRLIDDCRMLFEQQPREAGHTLRIDIGNGVSRVVVGDPARLRQVLVSVLLAAFRGKQGGDVELQVVPLDAPGWLRLDVRQAGGPGRDTGGLETSRRLCELMGGRLGVQPAAGEGTLYRIELPLHAAA